MQRLILALGTITLLLVLSARDVHRDIPDTNITANDARVNLSLSSDIDWASCIDCHDTLEPNYPPLSTFRPTALAAPNAACDDCHDASQLLLISNAWVHPVRTVSEHIECSTCHEIQPHGDSQHPGEISTAYAESACEECHVEVATKRSMMYSHGSFLQTCSTCHPAHEALSIALPPGLVPSQWREQWNAGGDWWLSNELCLSCHPIGEIAFTLDYGFATLNTVNYHDVHVLRGRALCVECHDPHGANRRGMIREQLLTGEIFSYSDSYNGGICNVVCHDVRHDNWQYINSHY